MVGGRALEDDEEGAEEPAPRLGNCDFYNTKASEYPPSPFPALPPGGAPARRPERRPTGCLGLGAAGSLGRGCGQ